MQTPASCGTARRIVRSAQHGSAGELTELQHRAQTVFLRIDVDGSGDLDRQEHPTQRTSLTRAPVPPTCALTPGPNTHGSLHFVSCLSLTAPACHSLAVLVYHRVRPMLEGPKGSSVSLMW